MGERVDSGGAEPRSTDVAVQPVTRHRALRAVGAFIVAGMLCLASMEFRPIESTVGFGLLGLVLGVIATRSPREGAMRSWITGAATGILALLAVYWASVWIHLEPALVVGRG